MGLGKELGSHDAVTTPPELYGTGPWTYIDKHSTSIMNAKLYASTIRTQTLIKVYHNKTTAKCLSVFFLFFFTLEWLV